MSKRAVLILLAFGAIYIVWGSTYLAVLFALESFPPFLLSGFRFLIAGLLLVLWCFYKKDRLPKGRALMISAISGAVMLMGGSGLISWAMQYIPSGQAAVIVATEPFFFVLLDRKRWTFYFSKKSIVAGLVTGFIGVAVFVLFSSKEAGKDVPMHLLVAAYIVLLVSCILWAGGSLYGNSVTKGEFSTTVIVAIQLLSAGLVGLIAGLASGETAAFQFADVTMKAWGGMIYLILFGSIVAFFSFMWLMTIRPPALVSTHTYVNPVIALFLGWLVEDEAVNPWQLLAVAIIIGGVILATNRENTK
jgi:drug/metabolite transporter (DMT)-like permease